ncbi:ParB/RepB/Spo0J family partition protein [Jannaschia pohangensis]|uniref:Chromosome partitioning protein, ParB family n=1 Tax=Jannaschia pohangensis TaxID=390807 RepID=A0A1I3UJE1_9RHOB|nr:ParB N-terminal domain-containing protein [Jannaschia pohangensis]SFJ83032.1 chromosome partitioning protein, ParB family [Jannaschia pohangensis]
MTSKNKFGFDPVETPAPIRRDRRPGPMGAAVRETAESLSESTDAKIEQRRRNAEDAKAFRAAEAEGRILVTIPLDAIRTDALPRDRLELEAVAASDEMEELKTSIRARGQREPIEVWRDDDCYQLKKGWRRLTALRQLLTETGDTQFATVTARIEGGEDDRLARYVDMVEENVVREDLTFAEMAQVALAAAEDGEVDEIDPDAMVGRLYGSLHKTKRSYIRAFVYLLSVLGDDLRWPKAVGRNLGVEVSRTIRSQAEVAALRDALAGCRDAEAQNRALMGFVQTAKKGAGDTAKERAPRPKLEFHIGATKITARNGECRIVSETDFAEVPRERLEQAIKAFEAELRGRPRIRQL